MKTLFITFLLLLLQSQPTQAQIGSPPGPEPTPTTNNSTFNRPKEVIIIAVISTLLFVGFYFIYLCFCIDDQPTVGINRWSNAWNSWRPWNNFTGSLRHHSLKDPQGLDPNVVKSFPIFNYGDKKSAMIEKGTLECVVCLMEFNDNDTLRLIPKCDHLFHADCVDNWLICHATCPVCRLNLTEINISDHVSDGIFDVGDDNERMMRRLLSRSLSTGHVAVKQWENIDRLPLDVRKQLITGESSSGRFCNAKARMRRGKSDSWVFNLGPSFFLKASFRKQLCKGEGVTSTSRKGSMCGSFRASTSKEGSLLGGVLDDQLV